MAALECHFSSHNAHNFVTVFCFAPECICWSYALFRIYWLCCIWENNFLLFQISGVRTMGSSLLPKASCSGFLRGVTSGFSEMCLFLFDGIPVEDMLASGVLKKILDI